MRTNPIRLWLAIGTAPMALAAGGPREILYVDNTGGNDITLVDTATRKAIGSIATGPAPHGLAASPDGTRLYVSSEGEDRLMAVDTTASTIVWDRPVGVRPNEIAVSADGRYVYVPIRSSDHVDVVDTVARRTIKSIKVGARPHNSYRSPNGKWIYVTSMGDNSFSIIDCAAQEVIATIPLGGEPRPLAITRDDRFVYAELTGLHGCVMADVQARKVVSSINLPPADVDAVSTFGYTPSHGIALRPDNSQLWITNVFGNAVEAFSVPDHKPLGSVPVGIAPNWMDFSSDGKHLFVSNPGSNDVSMIDTDRMQEVARIPVGLAPKRILVVQVPRGMDGPSDPGWAAAASRPSTTDFYLKDGGLLACETNSFDGLFRKGGLTPESAPAFYRNLGIRGIELDARYVSSWDSESLGRIAAAARREGRLLAALSLEGGFVSDDEEANQHRIDLDKAMLGAARSLGIPVVRVGLAGAGWDETAGSGAGLERAIKGLRQLVPLARELGIRLTVENGDGPARTPEDLLKIIAGTDPSWVGVCFNFENWPDQDAMRAAIQKLAPNVRHTHVKCAGFDRFGNERRIDYTSALVYLAKGGYGSALSVGFDGDGDPSKGVSDMRDLLVKLWIGKGIAPNGPPAG